MSHLLWFLLLLAQSSANVSEPTGLTYTIRFTTNTLSGSTPQVFSSEYTVYLQGDRKRTEYPKDGTRYLDGREQPSLVYILRCDMHKFYRLNMDTKEYEDEPAGDPRISPTPRRGLAASMSGGLPAIPKMRFETTTKDTGERKQMFGHTARHVITTLKSIPLEDSAPNRSETVMDGWYIDLNTDASCENIAATTKRMIELRRSGKGSPNITYVETGEPETGFVLELKTITKSTMAYPPGTAENVTMSESDTRITKFEEKPLDPALFEIPDGFHWVYSLQHDH